MNWAEKMRMFSGCDRFGAHIVHGRCRPGRCPAVPARPDKDRRSISGGRHDRHSRALHCPVPRGEVGLDYR